jgi:hypothetical protein
VLGELLMNVSAREKAAHLGASVRAENGVAGACDAIERVRAGEAA